MNGSMDKHEYYVNFNTQMFLSAKELLKSMPTFYNRVYFSSKYANALWTGDKEEYFSNVTLLTEDENIATLRQIIKTNFLYIGEWDSLRFTDRGDYGFSFVGGNIKYILMPFKETQDGYIVRSYDADTGDCYETTMNVDKSFFLNTSVNENGEFVRTCDFNLEYINDSNSKKERAPKKAQPTMSVYNSNQGYALTDLYLTVVVTLLCIVSVCFMFYLLKLRFFG